MSTGRTAGWAIAIAGITAAVSEAIRLLVEPLRFGPLGTAIVAVVTAVVVEAVGMLREPAAPRRPPPREPHGGGGYRVARPHRGGGRAVVLVVVLALVGAGVYGGSWLFRYVTGTQTGVERMAQPPAEGRAGALTLTVRGVEVTSDFMKFRLRAVNESGTPITVPVNEQWCRLVDGNGTS